LPPDLTTVETPKLVSFLKDYFQKEQVELVLIGMPLNWDETDTHSTQIVRNFIAVFKRHISAEVQIKEIDERYTSKMASQAMLEMGLNKKQRKNKTTIDEIAATIMLQDYLQST
jgi:putative Holliday junction resolvase